MIGKAPITEFRGEFSFLSNFYSSSFVRGKIVYETNEHFYQAHKTSNMEQFMAIVAAPTPGVAKRLGAKVQLIDNWSMMREAVMYTGLMTKFTQSLNLRDLLVATHPRELIEGNWWGDKYWGVCLKTNEGRNRLGQLLMMLRGQMRGV